MRWVRGALLAVACALLAPATAAAAATPATYDVGIANRTINPTAVVRAYDSAGNKERPGRANIVRFRLR